MTSLHQPTLFDCNKGVKASLFSRINGFFETSFFISLSHKNSMSGSRANQNFELLKKHTPYSVTRLGALYKDFSDAKDLNPEGYTANLISWTNILKVILEQHVIEDSELSLPHKKPDLASLLVLPTIGQPLSMDLIIRELVSSKALIPVSTFLKYESNIQNYIHPNTGFTTYLYPSYWLGVASSIGNGVLQAILGGPERYIHHDHLVDFTKHFLKVIKTHFSPGVYTSTVFDSKLLLSIIHDEINANFSRLDLEILLTRLSRDLSECSTKQVNDTVVIKFDQSEVTDEDVGIAQLRWNIHQVLDRMTTAELKMHEISSKISEYPVAKIKNDEMVKTSVKHLLTQKRMQAKVYAQCGDTLNSLNEIVHKIDDASTNINVASALKQSSITLRQLNAQVDLQEIDDIYLDIQEGIDETNRVTDALVVDRPEDNDEEVEEEYNALLKEQEAEEKSSDDLIKKLEDLNVDKEEPQDKQPQHLKQEEGKETQGEKTPALIES